MIEIDTWVAGGYKVRAFDWIDGKSIYLNICYYSPGSSLSRPPAVDRSFLLPLDMEPTLRNYLHSVVSGLMETPPNPSNVMIEMSIPINGSARPEPKEVRESPESASEENPPAGFPPCRPVPERWAQLLSALHRKTGHNGIVYTAGSAASELAIECGWMGKSSVYAGLKALCDCGVIRQVKRGAYQINPELLQSESAPQ